MSIMWISFLKEFAFILSTIIGFCFVGGFAIFPFLKDFRYACFMSPIMGLLFLALGVSSLYSVLGFSVFKAFWIMAVIGVLSTCLSLVYLYREKGTLLFPDKRLIGFIILVSAVITYLTNYTTIQFGHPGFSFADGTDHLGYAHLADWLNSHSAAAFPELDVRVPYQAWPEQMFRYDPRFGGFFILAIISLLRGMSAMFSYDSACALILVIGYIGVAAIYTRTPLAFGLLTLGLMTGVWFDFCRSGYLGKILGYPSILFIIGLFLLSKKPLTLIKIILLAALTCAVSILYSGILTALLLGFVGGIYILTQYMWRTSEGKTISIQEITDQFIILLLLIGVAIATTGILSRPLGGIAVLQVSWWDLLPRLFELEDSRQTPFGLSRGALLTFFWIAFSMQMLLCVFAIVRRHAPAFSLLAGSLTLLLVLVIIGGHWQAYVLMGIFYPLFLCATILLFDNELYKQKIQNYIPLILIIVLILVSISLHLPRLINAIKQYASSRVQVIYQFSKVDMDNLANMMRQQSVIVYEIDNPQLAIAVLVEFGRQNIKLQWTPKSWKAILAYRNWSTPTIDDKSHLYLQTLGAPFPVPSCIMKAKSAQYQLIHCNTSLSY